LLFTFYPCRADGASTAFETYELADDAAALARARRVLADHPSAATVVIWQGERQVGLVARETASA
jgi:hypothetical protein